MGILFVIDGQHVIIKFLAVNLILNLIDNMLAMSLNNQLHTSISYHGKENAQLRLCFRVKMSLRVFNHQNISSFCPQAHDKNLGQITYCRTQLIRHQPFYFISIIRNNDIGILFFCVHLELHSQYFLQPVINQGA